MLFQFSAEVTPLHGNSLWKSYYSEVGEVNKGQTFHSIIAFYGLFLSFLMDVLNFYFSSWADDIVYTVDILKKN